MSRGSYVSRGGMKLAAAIDAFSLEVNGQSCADFGCSTGGFTDCLLGHGAAQVIAVDTGYGVLDWKLRTDPRVLVMERANALHVSPPCSVDLVTVDLGWTRQHLAIPAAQRWLVSGGRIVTLIKPVYEVGHPGLNDDEAQRVANAVVESLSDDKIQVMGQIESPIRGSKGGTREWLALLKII